jgi:FO synthase
MSRLVTYSRKVFIPLTKLCRDVCHYCTFAQPPKRGARSYLTREEVLAIARRGAAAGCHEALFTLGDKPELRYRAARDELAALGHDTTVSYLIEMAGLVLKETGLLPHANPGITTAEELRALRKVCPSQGAMLETASPRLSQRGLPHHGSPDKDPAVRLEWLDLAGRERVPTTTGILIGIGETRDERLAALDAICALHARHGHIQEIIVQNFRAKPGTRMADAPEPSLEELVWTIREARGLFGPAMHIQAPPNLSPGAFGALIDAGIDDWGGVSPVTIDHVNPEAPWPEIVALEAATAERGKTLTARLTIYPEYARDPDKWLDPALRTPVLRAMDSEGYAREGDWCPGAKVKPPTLALPHKGGGSAHNLPLDGGGLGRGWSRDCTEPDIVRLFGARGAAFDAVCAAADALRREVNGAPVSYVVTRNINYTNVCSYRCRFCAFSKGRLSANLRGAPYDLDLNEISRRAEEAWARGATEVCMQGGIHPDYTGATYLAIVRAVKEAVPGMHVHAFSPLEIWQGAKTLGVALEKFLTMLRDAGLGSLPGTAAEILDDEVRAIICPDKVTTAQWFEVMTAAHNVGLRSTATIMFGHVDHPRHWARHLLRLRDHQRRTGGFTELVPLPFTPMEAPIYLRGGARRGPTYREAVLMHAVARLVLHPHFVNIQTSWVKMGPEGAAACLEAGCNDLGGTLMNETITRSAGAEHGEEMPPEAMERIAMKLGRTPWQRTTLYAPAPRTQVAASFGAPALAPLVNRPATRYAAAE